jgi:hypothetical protein
MGMIQHDCVEMWRQRSMETLLPDVHYSRASSVT